MATQSRRRFISNGLAIGTAIALGRRTAVREKKYGLIVAGKHPYRVNSVRCFIDGREITNSAFAANDREGWAKVFKRDATRILCGADRKPIVEKLYGNVRFEIA